jgi:MFS family permease
MRTELEAPVHRHPSYPRYFTGQVLSQLAYQMTVVAIGWQIYDLTNSAMALGMIGLVQFLPQFLLVLVAGHYADRHDRKRIASLCMLIQGSMAAVLTAGSWGGWITSEIIYVCAFVLGAARAFQSPAMQSMLPSLVERSFLPKAITYVTSARNFSAIAGPALGGGIYLLGAAAVYGAATVLFALASVMVAGLVTERATSSREPATLETVFAGIHYIRGRRHVLGAIAMDLFAVLLGGVTALLPIYARDILHTGPEGLGLLRAAPAAGALVMTVFLARMPLSRGVGRAMYASVAVFGLATIVFALSESLVLSASALMVAGDLVSVVIRSSLIQLETPDGMRGRVNAVNSIFTGASSQLGQFWSGMVAALVGAVPAAVIGGVGTLLVVALWTRLFPDLLRRDSLVTPAEVSPEGGRQKPGRDASR